MVQLLALGSEAGLDIPKALAIGQLGEGHDSKLVETGETFHTEIALVLLYTPLEVLQKHEVHNLSEDKRACIHRNPLPEKLSGEYRRHYW